MAKRAKSKDPTDTPMMRQYLAVKQQYTDAVVFYRMGDFYEMFFEDAVVAAEALDLTLTSRNKNDPEPIPMCGVPHHAAIGYVSRLIEKGFKVAICDQMEDPTKVKGLVKREVVRVVTPGVVLDEENLDAKSNNFLAAVLPLGEAETLSAAVAVIDVSTYEFKGTRVLGLGGIISEVFRLEPREVLVPASCSKMLSGLTDLSSRMFTTELGDESFAEAGVIDVLGGLLGEKVAAGLMGEDLLLARAAAACASYVQATRPKGSLPVTRFVRYDVSDHLILDEATKTHLELVRTTSGEKRGSLVWLLDQTRTGMGGRLLRQWINYPLTDIAAIRSRLDRVDVFFRDSRFRGDVLDALAQVGDVERLCGRVGMGVATPRDLGGLRNSLQVLPRLDACLRACPEPGGLEILGGGLDCAGELQDVLSRALVDEPPVKGGDGGIFREGFDEALDDLVATVRDAKDFISSLEQRERGRTGIGSLKVAYNKVFGYYIEVTRANLKNVPDDYVRKQTLATGERYVTPELEEWESKVLTADERRKELESELFERLLRDLAGHVPRLLSLARAVGEIDCAAALAEVARVRDFSRPRVDSGGAICLKESRHPLVEALQPDTPFVPNDILLDPEKERLLIITGPNMAGKSTVMRQVALIVLLAQMGSFVPARSARIGVCDRVFTRVGASDNIARGASTFMVEMKETSDILQKATGRSLVVLDEVGRGTSTYDGLSIAWAVGEYLHDAVRCKVMFATHYHELVDLARIKSHAANYHVAAREYGDDVVFLRKLVEGGTSRSFGIQVAKMAGLPPVVVQRAREVLTELEKERPAQAEMPKAAKKARSAQLELFAPARKSEVDKALEKIDVDRITPIEALSMLHRLKALVPS